MTNQKMFDKVWQWFVVEKNPQSVKEDTPDECLYRGPNGAKCAVGCVMPDSAYSTKIEGLSVARLKVDSPAKTLAWASKLPFISSALQNIHDAWRPDEQGDFTPYMEKELTKLAERHELRVPAIKVPAGAGK